MECVPDCPAGSVCEAGECRFVGCPDGLFECDGACVDLLSNPDHCGSCGSACIDSWPDDAPPLDALGLAPACADAQCDFVCPDAPDISVSDLSDNPAHCGACGATCGGELVTGGEAVCEAFECTCLLQGFTGGFEGNVCGDACTSKGQNCENGCCPTLAMGVNAGEGAARTQHAFVFEVDETTALQVDLEAEDCGQMQLVRYLEGGFVLTLATTSTCQLDAFPLVPGSYGLTLFLGEDGPYRLTRSMPDFQPLLTAPGRVERADNDGSLAFPFTVEAAGQFSMRTQKVAGNDCTGMWSSGLYAADGHQIFGAEGTRCRGFRETAYAELAAGDYVFVLRAASLRGARYGLTIGSEDHDFGPMRPEIEAVGNYPQPAIAAGATQTVLVQFAEAGTRRLRTGGLNGGGCTGDSVLSVGRVSTRRTFWSVAHNDDVDISGCSAVEFDAQAGVTYTVRVRGYNDSAIDAYSLIIE
jgi:hypothetical protein